MKKIILLVIISLIVCACSANSVASTTATPVNIDDAVKTISASTLLTITANAPTKTPQPTITPLPSATSTPPPQPIILKGSGDNVVDVNKWDGIALIKAIHSGQRNFIVSNYSGNEKLGLLINTIGNYSGTKLLDVLEHTTRLEVKADGEWEFQILPFSNVHLEYAPGKFNGTGDDVIAFKNVNTDLLKSNYPGNSNFIIMAWNKDGKKLAVNEIGPYTGSVILPNKTILLEITASGPWSIEVTAK